MSARVCYKCGRAVMLPKDIDVKNIYCRDCITKELCSVWVDDISNYDKE